MIHTILDNTIIILLTVLSIFFSKAPIFLIMVAAVLMIRITYQSFCEEKNSKMIIFDVVLMSAFSVLSGNFAGYLVFFFWKDVKIYYRAIIAVLMFVSGQLLVYKNTSAAMCMLQTIFLIVSYLLIGLIYGMIQHLEKRRLSEKDRIITSNISELHEKRLNEQLVMQKIMDEKNARLLERENISRNIHNSVGHSITAAIMTLDAADMLYDVNPDEARKRMNDANNRIRGSLESIRRAVRVLDEENVTLSAKDLKSEFDMIISEFVMDTSLKVWQNYSEISDDTKIPHDHVLFLTGVLQEILTNGVKHGNAGEFVVILLGDSAHIRLEISDNGNSDFDTDNSKQRIENGFGLKKIISYVERCGGKAIFLNENGFKSIVELPIIFGGQSV